MSTDDSQSFAHKEFAVSDEHEPKEDDCVHAHPIPAAELKKYSIDRDADGEQNIARYIELEAPDEKIQHVEKVKEEIVLGTKYEIWDVTTDKDRWWVINNLTNLYSQRNFPSLDYTLSFHIGLMMRIRTRSQKDIEDSPYDEVFRRLSQANDRHDAAIEAEDYQAVGMQLRECLISLVAALRRRVAVTSDAELPQAANFIAWFNLIADRLCPGDSKKELRHFLKTSAKECWQYVNWLTHHRNAAKTASSVAIEACNSLVSNTLEIQSSEATGGEDRCPICKSRDVKSFYDHAIEPDGDYYLSCGACGWTTHPLGVDRHSDVEDH